MPEILESDFFESAAFNNFYDHADPVVRARLDDMREAAETMASESDAKYRVHQDNLQTRDDLLRRHRIQENQKAQFLDDWTERQEKELARVMAALEKINAKLTVPETPRKKLSQDERAQLLLWQELTPTTPDFLKGLKATARFTYAPAETKGWTLAKARNAENKSIRELIALRRLPFPKTDSIRAAHSAVDKWSEKAKPDVRSLMREGRFEFPVEVQFSRDLNRSVASELGISFACWLDPDLIKRKLTAEINQAYGDVEGISTKDRNARRAELEAEFLRLQRIDAALCREAEDLGERVERVRLHPLAALEIVPAEDAPMMEAPQVAVTNSGPTLGMPHDADTPRYTVLPTKGQKIGTAKS